MSDLFGWDLIYKLSENDLKKKEDVLTLFMHFLLIKNGYKCIGLGDDKVLTGNEFSSETLPPEWNNASTYSIRYNRSGILYILKGLPVENNIVFNLLELGDATDMKVSNVAFSIDSVVASLEGDLPTIIPTYQEVLRKVQNDLLTPMGKDNTKEATTQVSSTISQVSDFGPLGSDRAGSNNFIPQPQGSPRWSFDPDQDPLRVGRSDLDPLAPAGGGGMLFNPFRRPPTLHDPTGGLGGPPLPRGAVPPGARFDPFGPVLPNPPRPRRPPGSDDFHPPGFGDMFM